jgi:hypothetical protein
VREDGSKYRVKRYHIVAMPEEVAT